jgi:hypothetical protein
VQTAFLRLAGRRPLPTRKSRSAARTFASRRVLCSARPELGDRPVPCGQERLEGGAGQRGRGLGVDWCVSNEQTEDDPAEEQVGGGSTFRSG